MKAMEQGRDFSIKPCGRKPYLKSRIGENEQRLNERKKTFRNVARQVWIANSLSKRQAVEPCFMKTNEDGEKMPSVKTSEILASFPSRPPSVKRKGTPEIFPMSSEMRKTLVLLGNLDLVPEDEIQKEEVPVKSETQKKISSFRQKTEMRIIQPQRFIRSFQNRAKTIVEKSSGGPETRTKTAESLINSQTSNYSSTLCAGHENEKNNNEALKLESLLGDEREESERTEAREEPLSPDVTTRVRKRNTKNPWQITIKKHQYAQVVPNPSNPFFLRKRFSPRRRERVSKSWQPTANFHDKLPRMRRSSSLGSPRIFASEPTDLNLDVAEHSSPMNDGKTIEEITSDIQERCSRWFEFRQKILMKSFEYK